MQFGYTHGENAFSGIDVCHSQTNDFSENCFG